MSPRHGNLGRDQVHLRGGEGEGRGGRGREGRGGEGRGGERSGVESKQHTGVL